MPSERNRQSRRLRGYDYTKAGAYFITTFTRHRECLFGDVIGTEIRLNAFGEIVREEWLRTFIVRPNLQSPEFVIMPNHFHAILVIADSATPVRANRRFALTRA